MTDHPALSRLRDLARALPQTIEREEDGGTAFLVGDEVFAEFDGAAVRVRSQPEGWDSLDLSSEPDWVLVEDRVAQSWELAAPQGLLEAGGR